MSLVSPILRGSLWCAPLLSDWMGRDVRGTRKHGPHTMLVDITSGCGGGGFFRRHPRRVCHQLTRKPPVPFPSPRLFPSPLVPRACTARAWHRRSRARGRRAGVSLDGGPGHAVQIRHQCGSQRLLGRPAALPPLLAPGIRHLRVGVVWGRHVRSSSGWLVRVVRGSRADG